MRSHLVDLGQIQDPLLDHPATKAEVDLADLLPGRDQKLKAELNLGLLLQFRSSHGFGLFSEPSLVLQVEGLRPRPIRARQAVSVASVSSKTKILDPVLSQALDFLALDKILSLCCLIKIEFKNIFSCSFRRLSI